MSAEINKLLEKTHILIEKENYKEALDLLISESNNPLYDLNEQNIIKSRIDILNKFLRQISIDVRWEKAGKNELIKIFNNEGYEISVLDKLFDKFGSSLTDTDYLKLQQVFLDDTISNEMKITYLNVLKDYGVKYTFTYSNTSIDKTFNVDLTKDFSVFSNEKLFKVSDKLHALYFKESSKENLSMQLVNSIYSYYFGDLESVPYECDELFNNLVDYIERAFNNIYNVNKEFSTWIDKILQQ